MPSHLVNPRVHASLMGALLLLVAAPSALAQEDAPSGAETSPPSPSPKTPAGEKTAPRSSNDGTDAADAPGGPDLSGRSAEAPPAEAPPDNEAPPATQPLVPRPTTTEKPAPSAPPPAEATPAQEPQDTERQEGDSNAQLKARLDRPKAPADTSTAKPHFPEPALRPEAAHPVHEQGSRTEVMPGNYVARPVTLPKGTFRMEFGQGLVLWDAPAQSALAPAFGLGITERLELGVDAPLQHDPGRDEWVSLHPRPHIAFTWVDKDEYEIGTRIRAVVPARPSIEPSTAFAVPVLWRASQQGRVDVIPELHVGVGSDQAIVARVTAKGTWQISPGMFAGLGGTANVGFVDSRDTGFDPELTFGLTHQNYGRSFVDFVTHFFAKSIAGGEPGHVSRGAGFDLALVFYPELY